RRGARHRFEVELLGRDDPSYASWMEELAEDESAPEMPEFDREEPLHGSIELSDWGIGFRELGGRDAHIFGYPGAYVAYVRRGSAASEAGLPRDVIITHVDEAPVSTIDGAIEFLRNSPDLDETVLFRVRKRDGLVAFYEVEVPSR